MLIEKFLKFSSKFPSSIALSNSLENITYSKLNAVTNKLAKEHLKRGQVVIISIDSGKDLIAVEIGCWKAGAIICPFDLKKDPRWKIVLQQLKPDLVVIPDEYENDEIFSLYRTQKVSSLVDWDALNIEDCNFSRLNDLSHLIFTSGTTGSPKCVGVRHQSLYDFARAKVQRSVINETSKVFLASSFTFDPQLGDLACFLLSGCSLILPNRIDLLNGRFGELLIHTNATHVCTTPAALGLIGSITDEDIVNSNLKEILVGGEKLPKSFVERSIFKWKGKPKLINTYGVTECCVYQSTKEISKIGDESLLGEPYESVNIGVYIFSDDNQMMREANVDEEGEICISGSFLGVGYVKNRNSESNLEFEHSGGFDNSFNLYRTGDLAKIINNHKEIQYLGRRDAQFKVNGIRIEAGEVEYAIVHKTNNMCLDCSVVLFDGKLVAFVVFQDELKSFTKVPKCVSTCLNLYLGSYLPQIYLPSSYFSIEFIPLASTGKIDRKHLLEKLQTIDNNNNDDDIHIKYVSDLEEIIADIWKDVLGITQPSPFDSFQSLGGDSLSALKAVNKLLTHVNKERINLDDVTAKAVRQAQQFGEIEGVFSAVTLLESPSLRSYTLKIQAHCGVKNKQSKIEEEENPHGEEEEDDDDDDSHLNRALMDACRLGLVHTVNSLINSGVSVNGRFVSRKIFCRTPLHEAAQAGKFNIVKTLLDHGAKVLSITKSRITPLHYAAIIDDPSILLELIKVGREQRNDLKPIFVCDKNEQTPLHFAARSGKVRIIQTLINDYRDFERNHPNINSRVTLFQALNMFDHWRRTPLHWAVVNFHLDAIKILLKEGALAVPPHMKIGKPGPSTHLLQETPLQLAIRRNAPDEIIDLLKQHS